MRLEQNSRSNVLNDLPVQRHRKGSLADRRGLNLRPIIEPRRKSGQPLRNQPRQHTVSNSDASWFLTLPDKIKQRHFTPEEQEILSGRLREGVILDAADEALYKASRRASRNLTPPSNNNIEPNQSSRIMGRLEEEESSLDKSMAETMHESFRWMDEEEDLDLKLVLDDYHANLDGFVIPTPDSIRKPSFRRKMSVTKIPFNRSAPSSIHSRSPKSKSPKALKVDPSHGRQKSRALSLIGPKHVTQGSVSSIDPNATHYQDPEARLKLRVYLASPQKFDEAIEFGFPSIDGVAGDKENKPPRISRDVIRRKSHSIDQTRSFFLNDMDVASLFEDDTSMIDPESPQTPMFADSLFKPYQPPVSAKDNKPSSDLSHLGITKPMLVKQPESHTQTMAGSREMTLRMTLTRPDLRADENTIYGWQTSSRSPLREEPLTLEEADEKGEVRGPFGGVDGWGPDDKEDGVVKRLWNKVRSSQKRLS